MTPTELVHTPVPDRPAADVPCRRGAVQMRIEVTEDQLCDLLDDPVYDKVTGTTRWGTTNVVIGNLDGRLVKVKYVHQPEVGLRDCNHFPLTGVEVEPVEETVVVTKYREKK